MVHQGLVATDHETTYDVQLRGCPADALWVNFPAARVHTTAPQTALRRESDPAELDALLQRLRSVGLVLVDVHRIAGPPAPSVYEVRVKGVLGESLLQYLHWPHYVVPAETRVRIQAAAVDLLGFLAGCTAAGVGIERVRKVDPAWTREPALA